MARQSFIELMMRASIAMQFNCRRGGVNHDLVFVSKARQLMFYATKLRKNILSGKSWLNLFHTMGFGLSLLCLAFCRLKKGVLQRLWSENAFSDHKQE